MTRYDGAARVDLGAGRFADFSMPFEIEDDWSSDGIEAQVRLYPDAPGVPVAVFTITPLNFVGGITSFAISMEQRIWPVAPEPGSDLTLSWDMVRDGPDGRRVVFYGDYIVHAGVSQ